MYIPLFNKTNYSLLSSLIKVDDLINYAIYNKIPSIAICDINMYGVMEFIKKCNNHNIKPIIGLNIKLSDFDVCLFVKDYTGYKNIIKLSTIQNERVIEINELKKYSEQLICVVPYEYKNNLSLLNNIYDDIYMGYNNKAEEKDLLKENKKIVFFRENLYINKSDSDYLPYIYNIRDGKSISDNNNYDILYHEMNINNIDFFSDNVGILNTIKISDCCNLEFPIAHNLLPIYECDDPKKYLFELCKVGLSKRLNGNINEDYKKRLSYELKVINDMGFSNYFLVVYDFIKYSKKNGILVGPGRGSAAGSLVAYSLGITDIDPLKYDLLFERFLNPERKTMPDIDTDFPDSRRNDVINYVIDKYGKKRVSGIVTFGTLGVKQVIRDVGRVLNIPTYKIDSLCKYIPGFTKDKLIDFYNSNNAFKAMIDSDIALTKLYSIALKIEGFPRHTSSHAAGIVMSQVDLDEVVPLTVGDGMYLTSYSMEYLEELGLLKMDFLGLKNLTIINNIIKDIKDYTGEIVDFSKIPLDDKETLNVFETSNTSGIFQFESVGMRNFLRRLKPNSFEDIFSSPCLRLI